MTLDATELDELIRIEGALDFIRRGFTKAQHVDCYKLEYQAEEAAAYDVAMELVREFHSARKVHAQVLRAISTHR